MGGGEKETQNRKTKKKKRWGKEKGEKGVTQPLMGKPSGKGNEKTTTMKFKISAWKARKKIRSKWVREKVNPEDVRLKVQHRPKKRKDERIYGRKTVGKTGVVK